MARSSSMIAPLIREIAGLELDAPFEIVFLDRVDQAEDAVRHQIGLLDVRWQADRDPASHVLDQRRVVEDESLAGVSRRLELEFLPQPFHGRRLVQEAPPLAGRDRSGRSGVCYPTRRAGTVVAPARLAGSGARMRLLVDAAEPLVRNVSVGLGRGQGNVPE